MQLRDKEGNLINPATEETLSTRASEDTIMSELPRKRTLGATLSHDKVTVGTTATPIVPANPGRRSVIIQNLGSADVFIGGSGVTVDNAPKISPGQSITLDNTTAEIYGISTADNQDVRYLEEAD